MRRLLGILTVAVLCVVLAPPAGGMRPDFPGPTSVSTTRPLAGRVIVLDAGHQLGNHNFPRKINRLVPAGGFKKPCNTTGTATNDGYSEATLNFRVARLVRARLLELGARVLMSRTTNREDRWGPCVDVRGRQGNKIDADLKISIHGDGSDAAGAHGFHVIAPTDRAPWTHDIFRSSRHLAREVRASLKARGVPVANYIAGGDGLDFRSDLGTLNLSDIPTVMVELGNMRGRADARRMTTRSGRATYARALVGASRAFLDE
jgi:N-acetylmuramoyl-L-alanine amidase